MNFRELILFLLLGWVILVLQSTVISYMSYGILQPELLLVILVHAGVYRRGMGGVALALSYGYLMDLFSCRPFGSYLFLYVSLFFVSRLLSARLLLQTRAVQVVLVFLFTLASELVLHGLYRFFSGTAVRELVALELVSRAAINAVGVVILFPWLSWVERRFWRKPGLLRMS